VDSVSDLSAFLILVCGWVIFLGRSPTLMLNTFMLQTLFLGFYILFALAGVLGFGTALLASTILFLVLVLVRALFLPIFVRRSAGGDEWLEYCGTTLSLPWLVLILGIVTASAFLLTSLLPWNTQATTELTKQLLNVRTPLSVGLSVVFLGIALMMSRRDLVAQSIGIIVMENGLYLSGTALVSHFEKLIIFFTIGSLVYVVLTVLTLRILLHHVQTEIGSLHMDRLRALRG